MKGQANLLIFILLFIISLFLFVSASIWSTNIFQQNIDVTNIQNAEKFMRGLDIGILNLVKYGGSQEFRYNIGGTIQISTDTIEIKIPISIQLQKNWINLTSDGSFIQERQEGNILRIQAVYNNTKGYKIEFIPGGPSLANPEYIMIERNSTYTDINGLTVIRIKITFA